MTELNEALKLLERARRELLRATTDIESLRSDMPPGEPLEDMSRALAAAERALQSVGEAGAQARIARALHGYATRGE